jgi:predicted nucleotidyltransferase
MSTASEIEARLSQALAEAPDGVLAAYLFGSAARGELRPRSDVDVAVLFVERPPATLDSPVFALASRLEGVLRLPVEVVALNTAPPDLVHRVLRDGKLLLERDRSARIRFEVRARNEYFDMARVRAAYRRAPPFRRP